MIYASTVVQRGTPWAENAAQVEEKKRAIQNVVRACLAAGDEGRFQAATPGGNIVGPPLTENLPAPAT